MRRSVVVALLVLAASPLAAQSGRFELSPFFGYSLSDGFETQTITTANGSWNGVKFEDGITYGLSLGYYVNQVTEVEFQWSRQESRLQGEKVLGGTQNFMDVALDNYHVNFVYNAYTDRRKVRPYILIGLGATVAYPGDYKGNSPDNEAYFSGTLGAGIKAAIRNNLGLKLQARWTPTYIHSTNEGYWCDPWYGCWTVGDAEYLNQFAFTAGVNFRFGN